MFKVCTLNNIAVGGLRCLPTSRYVVGADLAEPDAYLVRSFNMHEITIPASVRAVARAGAAEENSAVMVVENLKAFLEDGSIRHSVNFPDTVLERKRPHRLAIPHRNVPNMVAQILTCLAQENINIAEMVNGSRNGISYTVVDTDSPASREALARIAGIDGILSVRVLPIIES
jgi:hypothetical protein